MKFPIRKHVQKFTLLTCHSPLKNVSHKKIYVFLFRQFVNIRMAHFELKTRERMVRPFDHSVWNYGSPKRSHKKKQKFSYNLPAVTCHLRVEHSFLIFFFNIKSTKNSRLHVLGGEFYENYDFFFENGPFLISQKYTSFHQNIFAYQFKKTYPFSKFLTSMPIKSTLQR